MKRLYVVTVTLDHETRSLKAVCDDYALIWPFIASPRATAAVTKPAAAGGMTPLSGPFDGEGDLTFGFFLSIGLQVEIASKLLRERFDCARRPSVHTIDFENESVVCVV